MIAAALFGSQMPCLATSSKSQRTNSDFNAIKSAILGYRLNTGQLPPPELGLQALVTRPESLSANMRWVQTIERLPNDPWGHPYGYMAGDGLSQGFGLYSCGPDGATASAGNDPDDLNTWDQREPPPEREISISEFQLLLLGFVISVGTMFFIGRWSGRRQGSKRLPEEVR